MVTQKSWYRTCDVSRGVKCDIGKFERAITPVRRTNAGTFGSGRGTIAPQRYTNAHIGTPLENLEPHIRSLEQGKNNDPDNLCNIQEKC